MVERNCNSNSKAKRIMGTRQLTWLAVLMAQSLVLFIIEGNLPMPVLPPGAKLGLANLITVIALYMFPKWWQLALLVFLRVLLGNMFAGNPAVFMYSVAGAFLSLLVMLILHRLGDFNIYAISGAGGFFHNVGQLVVASYFLGTHIIWYYLPILGICGIGTGLLIGFIANRLLGKLPKFIDAAGNGNAGNAEMYI